jgi:ubiquinone/menaquinone biosynthesis C-methylase UbiE
MVLENTILIFLDFYFFGKKSSHNLQIPHYLIIMIKQLFKIFFFIVNCQGQHVPRSINLKRTAVSVSSIFSVFGLYAGFRFLEDEKKITSFKELVFTKYIKKGMSCLEIGYGADGDGANIMYYPKGLELTAIDPLIDVGNGGERRKVAISDYEKRDIKLQLMHADCESLPFPSKSFDAVVCTLVLCTVRSPEASIAEVLRVLRPGGVFICQEHLRGEPHSSLAFQQELFDPIQQALANNCHLTRDTQLLLDQLVGDGPGYKFSKALERDIVQLSSHWPISRQLLAVYLKQ